MTTAPTRCPTSLYIGVACIAFATLLFEIALNRVFAVVFWYHFAFLIVSVALFGFALSGFVIHHWPTAFGRQRAYQRLMQLSILSSALFFTTLVAAAHLPFAGPLPFRFAQFAIIGLLATAAFLLSGLCIGIPLTHFAGKANQLYFADLLGASLGCFLAIPAIDALGGPNTIILAAFVATLAAVCFIWPNPQPTNPFRMIMRLSILTIPAALLLYWAAAKAQPLFLAAARQLFTVWSASIPDTTAFGKIQGFETYSPHLANFYTTVSHNFQSFLVTTLALSALLLLLTLLGSTTHRPRAWASAHSSAIFGGFLLLPWASLLVMNSLNPFLDIRFEKGRPFVYTMFTKWNSLAKTDVHPGNTDRPLQDKRIMAWGLSDTYPGPVVDQIGLNMDGQIGTPITRFDGNLSNVSFVKWDVSAFPYHLRKFDNVLIIGLGGGKDVLAALAFGNDHITGVEINPTVVEVVNDVYGGFSGELYRRPGVAVHIAEGRSFIASSSQRFDLIQLSFVDTFAGTVAGAYALTENYLYTVEAFRDYFLHLTDHGILSVTRFYLTPARQGIRVVSLALVALERLGVPAPSRNLIAIRGGDVVTVMAKRSPFTTEEIRRLNSKAAELGFEVIYSPLNPNRNPYTDLIESPQRDEFYSQYPLDISPTTDDRPFFFNVIKVADWLNRSYLAQGHVYESEAIWVLVQLLVISALLAAVFAIWPIVRRGEGHSQLAQRTSVVFYFACLGMGFIVVEVLLMQRLILFLGHPTYAVSIVLFSLLLSASLGSLVIARVRPFGNHPAAVAFGLACLIALYPLASSPLFESFIGLELWSKVLLSLGMITPLGFLMGSLFPLGIRRLAHSGSNLVPVAWGVNGAFSVFGGVMAVALMMVIGVGATFLVGALVYGLAGALWVAQAW